jgi:small subunit ribosomal protein S2
MTAGNKASIDAMFGAGAHYGFVKSRRHPTVKPFIFGTKNKIEIFDLEKTDAQLERAVEFVKSVAAAGKQVLFLGSKSESKDIIKRIAETVNQPYVAGRWVGGTFTNFELIRKRAEKLMDLSSQKEKGELNKYTKRERLMIDREIARLENLFGGIVSMNTLPAALFVVDSKKEDIAVLEAREKKIPVVSISGSDCDISKIQYPIVANDTAIKSIEFFTQEIANAYKEAKKIV